MGALAGLQKLEFRAAGDHFLAEADEAFDDIAKGQRFRPAAADREHVRRETRLRRSVPPQLVEYDLGGSVALEIDDHAHALATGFVANIGDALNPFVLGGL